MWLPVAGANTHRPLSSAPIRSVGKKRMEVMRTSRTSFTVWWVCRCFRRSYVVPTAACRQQQQQQRGRRRSQSIRRPCQQGRRQHQKFDFVFLLNSSCASTFISYASTSTVETFSVFFCYLTLFSWHFRNGTLVFYCWVGVHHVEVNSVFLSRYTW